MVKALVWTKENCKEGRDINNGKKSRTSLDKDWETVVKMTLIARDLMIGNPRLAEMGFGEEALGHNAIFSGFQGQRQWTDHYPNGDFLEAILNTSYDWNGPRQPYIVATENDSLNGATMLLGHLLTNTAQVFADVRTYWSPEAVKRVTGYEVSGRRQADLSTSSIPGRRRWMQPAGTKSTDSLRSSPGGIFAATMDSHSK